MPYNASLIYFSFPAVPECKTRPRNEIIYWIGSGVGDRRKYI